MIETVLTCPLGHKCEEIKDNKIYRCAWFTTLAGRNPQTGENIDEKACAIAWLPLMQVEVAQSNRATSEAVVSLREETVKRQDAALSLVMFKKDNDLRIVSS
jgi:uncharacterized LabA/DUF88 family protein